MSSQWGARQVAFVAAINFPSHVLRHISARPIHGRNVLGAAQHEPVAQVQGTLLADG